MQLGHAVGFGPLKTDFDNHITGEFARLERGFHLVLVMEHAHRRFDNVVFGGHSRDLDHAGTQIARQPFQTAGGGEGIGRGAQDTRI